MRPTVLFYVWLPLLAHSHRRPGILAARDGCRGNAQGWPLDGGSGRDRGRVEAGMLIVLPRTRILLAANRTVAERASNYSTGPAGASSVLAGNICTLHAARGSHRRDAEESAETTAAKSACVYKHLLATRHSLCKRDNNAIKGKRRNQLDLKPKK